MQAIDFFAPAYRQEAPRNDAEFGIYDPGNSQPALTTLDTTAYQAVVKNPNGLSLQFVAVDHNIPINRDNGDAESTCDGMLYVDNQFLSFIELKDRLSGWASEAAEQLQKTIEIFKANHDSETFAKRYAYAANIQHPNFHRSFKEVMQKFRSETKFNLRFKTVIEEI